MSRESSDKRHWWLVVLFAIGMAWVESACVFYLRVMVDRIQPYQSNPLPINTALGPVELAREAATMVMLFTIGMIAGRSRQARWGYTALAFGVWDIFYYVFLRVMAPWPQSLFDWDILFLLPLPWWGPVIAPVSIACLLILWGTVATQTKDDRLVARLPWTARLAGGAGMVLALYVFMADAIRIADQGEIALRQMLPQVFEWQMFIVAFLLMALPVLHLTWQSTVGRRALHPSRQEPAL